MEARSIVRQLGVLAALSAVHSADISSADQPPITRWGRFETLTPIGKGSNGTVYQCWDPLLERSVALKLLHSKASDDRTLAEARLLAKVRHPNIVTVYGVDWADGRLGIWMELLTGRTLKEEIAVRGPFSARDAALVGADLCRGLAAVHAAGLVHGDVKAQNVVREQDGRVVLMDFGAGVNHDAAANDALPIGGGTPHYMAPELFEGCSVSVRSDVYSLGALVFHLVTGEFPFKAGSIEELAEARGSGRRRALRDLRSDVPIDFARVVERALAERPEDRFGNALALEEAFRQTLPVRIDRDRRLRTAALWSAVAVIALAAAAAIGLWHPGSPVGAQPVKSLAVLPFENLSGTSDDDYLADGMMEMLTSDLAQFNSLRVTSRTSAMRYRNSRESSPAIGQALHVDALVEGSVTHAKGRLRVTAQVIRASTDEHIWSQTFERADDDLFALQAQVAATIAGVIKLVITPTEHRRVAGGQPVKPAAQDAYLRGRYLLDQPTAESQSRAFDYFKHAVDLDPSYARAYAALARNYVRLESVGVMPRATAYAAAYEAAARAVAIDDDLADGHAELADILLYYRWDWSAADREYRRSLDLNRSNTLARSRYSRFLSATGRHGDALEHARLTVDGDPFSAEALMSVPLALYYAGRFDESARGFREALQVFPNSAEAHFGVGRALAGTGDFAGAEREIGEARRLTGGSVYIYDLELARTLAAAGRSDESLELVRTIEAAGRPISPQYLGYIHAALGNHDKAFAYLDEAVRQRVAGLLWAKVDPRLSPLHGNPRFKQLLQTLGVPD